MTELLTDLERQILDFEKITWKYPGSKEQAIRERFGLLPTHYYQELNRLIDSREALEVDPIIVNRLRDKREETRQGRR